METIIYRGKKYRRYAGSNYFRGGVGGTTYLHRRVWEDHHGAIPDGHHIHHKDGNPANNNASNLECLPVAEHFAQHPWSEERKRKQSKHLDRIRPLSKSWHASAKGRAKHREIGALAYANFEALPKQCEQCQRWFIAKKLGNVDKYCSNACKSAARRASGIDDEQRVCAACGVAFMANRYTRIRTCSRSCANHLRARG